MVVSRILVFGNSDSGSSIGIISLMRLEQKEVANNDAVEVATIKKDIVTTAIENGSFTPQLNLVPTLTHNWWSLHTVFAPTYRRCICCAALLSDKLVTLFVVARQIQGALILRVS